MEIKLQMQEQYAIQAEASAQMQELLKNCADGAQCREVQKTPQFQEWNTIFYNATKRAEFIQ